MPRRSSNSWLDATSKGSEARADGTPWLDKARRRLETAEAIAVDDPESAFILTYDAARFVGEALLAQQGLRPTQAV